METIGRMIAPRALEERRRLYVGGEQMELWENAEVAFGWTEDELSGYASNGNWELLFNGLVLASQLAGFNEIRETSAGWDQLLSTD
jgi:hypothetical protein